MATPGRNDPCYCGSGKKYKQCHWPIDQAQERKERAQADAARFLRRELPAFASEDRFEAAYDAALPVYWNDFYDAENDWLMNDFEALRFLDWFVFDYELPEGQHIVDIYMQEQQGQLTEEQRTLLESWLEAPPFSAYELVDYEGQRLQLRDHFTSEELEVFEAGGRGNVEVGEIILTRLVPVFGRWEFSTVAAYLPDGEAEGLTEKMEAAKAAFMEAHPQASHGDFMRANNHLIIHHALAQAEAAGRPPVARMDPQREDKPVPRRENHEHDRERIHRQRNYGRTQPHIAQTRRKAI